MGVTGLWSLVDSVGHPINLETLHNKVIAIDLSLWVNQSIKGFRGRNGQTLENAHVLGLFHRICKLLFYKIKPVFVFDGKCPELKKNTIAKRAEQRLKAVNKSRQSSIKILQNYVASQVSKSGSQMPSTNRLPSLESSVIDLPENKNFKVYEELAQIERNKELSEESEESDSEPRIAHSYGNIQNFESIDVNSDDFKALPPDIKYEILTEMKQKYKGYRNTDIMPKESNDFSNYQMEKLLKKRVIQSKIEDTIRQLNGQQSEEILQDWDKKGFSDENNLSAGQLVSDENVRFVLLKKSQTNSSNVSQPNEESSKNKDIIHVASTSRVDDSIEILENSSDFCQIMSDSSESECDVPSIKPPLESVTNQSSNSIITEPKPEEKTNPVLEAFIFDDIIEISDESDVELVCNKSFEKTSIDKPNMNENTSFIKDIVSHEFTKIKDKKIDDKAEKGQSESSDDFEEVSMEECHQIEDQTVDLQEKSDQQISVEKEEQNHKQNVSAEVENKSLSDNEFNSSNDFENKSIPQSVGSQVISPPKMISREELMEVTREMNKQNRFANHTNEQMMIDCQELLSLFGIPFVVSPTEAEAQCAALEELGLTDGTITDDSDVLLFGAQTVYKNFFTSSKYVELFKAADIESRFGLTRSSMICIAMLCGSDYTEGVEGVGAVKATEILSEFPGEGLTPLIELKKWWENKQKSNDKRPENPIRAKFLKLKLNESFPNRVIFDAYMKPTVDTSKERFVWGIPRLDELRDYTRFRFGWSANKCDEILLPIMKKVNEKQTQMTIDNYFKIQVQPKDMSFVSKRMNSAINKLKGIDGNNEHISSNTSAKSLSLAQKVKNQRKRRQKNQTHETLPKKKVVNKRPQEINLSESSDSD